MKKIILLISVTIIVLAIMMGIYMNYKFNLNISKKENLEYEYYIDKEITGIELSTLINKAIDNNEKCNVSKDKNGLYNQNNENSINIKIEFIDNEKIYSMESIYNGNISKFIDFYGNIKFKCELVEYHQSTNKIKSLYFKQQK